MSFTLNKLDNLYKKGDLEKYITDDREEVLWCILSWSS